jgi:hypothetical protein
LTSRQHGGVSLLEADTNFGDVFLQYAPLSLRCHGNGRQLLKDCKRWQILNGTLEVSFLAELNEWLMVSDALLSSTGSQCRATDRFPSREARLQIPASREPCAKSAAHQPAERPDGSLFPISVVPGKYSTCSLSSYKEHVNRLTSRLPPAN